MSLAWEQAPKPPPLRSFRRIPHITGETQWAVELDPELGRVITLIEVRCKSDYNVMLCKVHTLMVYQDHATKAAEKAEETVEAPQALPMVTVRCPCLCMLAEAIFDVQDKARGNSKGALRRGSGRPLRAVTASFLGLGLLLLALVVLALGPGFPSQVPTISGGEHAIFAGCTVTALNAQSECSRHVATAATSQAGPVGRLLGDIAAIVSSPYRYLRMASITKEVGAAAKVRFESARSADAPKKGGGAAKTLKSFLPTYMRSHVIARTQPERYRELLSDSLNLLIDSIMAETPFNFKPYHQAIRGPGKDLYAWGNAFFRSMVKFRTSRVIGSQHLASIKKIIDDGENVILLANHQTEADPQVLSLLLEREGVEELAEKCIFVAGHKVTTDPLAIPFSMGRYLLTIFSKKYLDTFEPEEKEVKSARNQETVAEMQRLMKEGGHMFWVAPSGGRDRKSPETGRFIPAKFDPQSVGLFQLLAQKAAAKGKGAKTHFFPLAMWTNQLVPPPDDTKAGVGEERSAARAPVALAFGPEMVPDDLGGRKESAGRIS
ncbi:unnamed protein product [Polarella glacialis]|uniref:Phospholipid/glycerol acyltransferase domain-containing protein n=1 Tax=Polarella glacialis TaxID=89957 RepID=A0A813KPJ0_POLGL|nr:unnamed protein product [Polarella glacialis]